MKRGGTIASILRRETGLGSEVDLATPMLEGKDFSQPSTIETIAEVSEPQLEVDRGYFAPVVKDHHGQAGVERVDRGAFHDDDTAAAKRIPGAVTIEAAAVGTHDEGMARIGGNKVGQGEPALRENDAIAGAESGADIRP